MKLKSIFIQLFCILAMLHAIHDSSAHAQLKVESTNDFYKYTNLHPGRSTDALTILSMKWKDIIINFDDGENIQSTDLSESLELTFTDPPLVFPNPFRVSAGGALGYGLSKGGETVELRIYDMFGLEVLRKHFINQQGANIGYNKITLNSAFFDNKSVPAGVYFLLFLHNNKLLGKTKMAVAP